MANSFSLLQIPRKEQLRVLRCMDARDLLLLSLLSRNAKDLVRSLQLKSSSFDIMIGHLRFAFDISYPRLCLYFYKEPEENMRMLEKPKKVWISKVDEPNMHSRSTVLELPNPLELKDWLDHILYIFNSRQADRICFSQGSDRFDLKAIKEKLANAENLLIFSYEGPPPSQARVILKMFLPDFKSLKLAANPFRQGDGNFQKMLTQKVDILGLGFFNHFDRFTLNDLFVCNATNITLSPVRSFKRINQFLKLWMKGANSRLQKLVIFQTTNMILDEILKGIKIYKIYSVKEDIVYNDSFQFPGNNPHRAAVAIRRFDGTRGTIVVVKSTFCFIVGRF